MMLGNNGLHYFRVGPMWILFRSKKNSQPVKCLTMPQNPTREVQILMGVFHESEKIASNSFSIILAILGTSSLKISTF